MAGKSCQMSQRPSTKCESVADTVTVCAVRVCAYDAALTAAAARVFRRARRRRLLPARRLAGRRGWAAGAFFARNQGTWAAQVDLAHFKV